MEEGKSSFKILTGKPIGKGPLLKHRIVGRRILDWIIKK